MKRNDYNPIKVDDLFSPLGDTSQSYFFASNKIVSDPSSLTLFFRDFSQYSSLEQEKVLNELITILETVTTNAYALNSISDSPIIQQIIDLLPSYVENYLIFGKLMNILNHLLKMSELTEELVSKSIQRTVSEFHENNVDTKTMFAAINVLKSYFKAKTDMQKQPPKILIFHGSRGPQISPLNSRKDTNWLFSHGMSVCLWINTENIKVGNEVSLPKLFTFYSANHGGLESFLIDNKVYYRMVGAKYTQPSIGSNGLFVGQLEPHKWNFICFQHEGNKPFSKSKLTFYLNKNKSTFSIDPPRINSSHKTKYVFFDRIYCRASSIAIFPYPIGQNVVEELNKNLNSINSLKNSKAFIFEQRQRKFYQRSGFGYSDIKLIEKHKEMNFKIVLPFFYLLRFIEKNSYPLLDEIFSLFIQFLCRSSANQTECYNQNYMKIISELIKQIPHLNQHFNKDTINVLLSIKQNITNRDLLDQYYSDLLWPLAISKLQITRRQEILQIIKNSFTLSIAHFSSLIGLDEMINGIVGMETKTTKCCQKHFKVIVKRFDYEVQSVQTYGEEEIALNYILQMVQLYFEDGKINCAVELYKLCRLLMLKFSPCFTLSLMAVIKKIIIQKFNEKLNKDQSKKIIKHFTEKKVYLIFLHVIENNFFAEIKAESARIIYQLLLKKSSQSQEVQVSRKIAQALWKINEQALTPMKSLKNSKRKLSSPMVEPPEQVSKKIKNELNIEDEVEKEEEQFKLLGPQAPTLTNREKGKKTFNFNFINEQKEESIQKEEKGKKNLFQEQIMEEEKTNQNEMREDEVELFQPPIKKKKKNFGLSINTQAINEMYTFGGEKGQQIMISEEQETNELEKIKNLAKKCVAAMKKETQMQEEMIPIPKENERKYFQPPSTTSNKVLQARQKKPMTLQLIDEEEQQGKKPISQPSPNFTNKMSLHSPSSLNSFNEQNLISLYNSLLQCCLGMTFQTMTLEDSKIRVPSVLYVFFNWIPLTNLQIKFINDLDIIFQSEQNLAIVTQMPELYDFICELVYKAFVCEEYYDRTIYMQKLQALLKKIWAYIFRKDPNGLDKFSFAFDWTSSKCNQYDPKCLFFTVRHIIMFLVSSIEEQIGMNAKIDQLMTENFQSVGKVIESLRKFIPCEEIDGILFDGQQNDRIVFDSNFKIIGSLVPFYNQREWVDYLLCEKYQILFKKYFCTTWYKRALEDYSIITNGNLTKIAHNLEESLKKSQLTAEANYYLRNQFIFSLIQINRSLLIDDIARKENISNREKQLVWQTILLILFSEIAKEKVSKVSSSQIQLLFLKNCKFFSNENLENAVYIVPILKQIRNILQSITKQSLTSSQDLRSSTKVPDLRSSIKVQDLKSSTKVFQINNSNILENLMLQHIKQELFDESTWSIKSFKLNFDDIWLSSEGHYRKLKSEAFQIFKQKIVDADENTISYIEHISEIIEEEIERSQSTDILIEACNRIYRNEFRKMWKNLQIFGTTWTHPNFSWQNDILFNKNSFSYERYEPCEFFKYKISKHVSKFRFRYLLKPRLIQPHIVKQLQMKDENQKNDEIGLQKAIIYSTKKLSVGKRLLSWLVDKNDEGIDMMMNFKKVRLIKTLTVRHGYISLINDKLVFITAFENERESHLSIERYKLRKNKTIHKVWPLELIKQIFKRRFLNQQRALQITFINGKSIFLDFYENNLKQFMEKIGKYKGKCVNLTFSKTLDPKSRQIIEPLQKKWINYQISNFQYLQQINNLAGRSYSDLTQYPVFPWILINFANKLALSNEENYRNLALPMGALGTPERAEQFRQRFEEMIPDQNGYKFHYGTHYSSPGIVYHFLIRLSPFTEGGFLLQGGKFDFADRLYFSISDSFKNATSEYSDVREMVPEMYTIPESYLNINKLDLGIMQNKKRVHNIELPEWSKDNPYLYVTKLRRAFEDNTVSKNIHKWIDLIFGFKQRGEEAIKNINCFVHITYEDAINFVQVENEKHQVSLETQVLNFGQTPSLVFKKQHPERHHISSAKNYNAICDYLSEPRTYRPSKNSGSDLLKEERELNPLRQVDKSIIHMKWFKQSSLVFIRRNGEMLFYKWFSNHNTNSKAPFQCSVEKQKKVQRINKLQHDANEFYDPSLKVQSFPIQFINSGHHLVLGGLIEGKILLIDVDTNHVVETYTNHQQTVCQMKADTKDNFLITGDIGGNVIVWRITSNHRLSFYGTFSDHTEQINSIFICYDMMSFVTAANDGAIFMYNLMTGKKMRTYYHPKNYPVNHALISTSPLPVLMVFSNLESIIYCYSINGQLIQRIHEKEIEHFIYPILMKDSSGFEYLAYGNELGQTIFRTLPFLDNPKKQVVVKDASVNRVCVSKNGRFVVTGCSDGELSVITVPQLQP